MRKRGIVILGVMIIILCSPNLSATKDYRGIEIVAEDGEILTPFMHSWAVIIGINDYKYIGKLKYAINDAKAVKQLLQNKFGFADDHILTLYNDQATKRDILHVLGDKLPYKIGEQDRLLVYFAGHGETNLGNGYLIPVDYRQGEYRATSISMTELKDILKDIKAKHIYMVLDACYSGMFFTQRASAVSEKHPRYLREITKRKARQALTAGGKEPVTDGGYKNHSVFTGIFLEALNTGYADFNGDNIITASEINAYIQPKVAELAEQTPEFGNLPGSEGGEFVFLLSSVSRPKSPANIPIIPTSPFGLTPDRGVGGIAKKRPSSIMKEKPSIMFMIAEQNIGQQYFIYWWRWFSGGAEFTGQQFDLSVAETTLKEEFLNQGIDVVDISNAAGKIRVSNTYKIVNLTNDAVREIGRDCGADVVVKGKVIAKKGPKIAGSSVASYIADITMTAIRVYDGAVLGAGRGHGVARNISEITGGTLAIEKASRKVAEKLIEQINDNWKHGLEGE